MFAFVQLAQADKGGPPHTHTHTHTHTHSLSLSLTHTARSTDGWTDGMRWDGGCGWGGPFDSARKSPTAPRSSPCSPSWRSRCQKLSSAGFFLTNWRRSAARLDNGRKGLPSGRIPVGLLLCLCHSPHLSVTHSIHIHIHIHHHHINLALAPFKRYPALSPRPLAAARKKRSPEWM